MLPVSLPRSANAVDLLGSDNEHISCFIARVHPEDRQAVHWEGGPRPEPPAAGVQFRYFHPDGRLLWLRSVSIKLSITPETRQIVGITTDITEQKNFELQLARAANYDPLTGLSNRRYLAERFDAALEQSFEEQGSFALVLIDLDHFKPVNDLYGHAAGDHVLCEVAERLKALSGREGIVARLGGDEFAMLVRAPNDPERQEKIADLAYRVVESIREPIVSAGLTLEVGASLGIALCPSDGENAEGLLHAADLAMYRAKQDGRNTFRFFEHSMDVALRARAALEADLRAAVALGNIRPFYQPLVGLDVHDIYGFEILARWPHAEHGFVPPDVFIPLAEQMGLIDDLMASVLRQACRDARDWGDDVRLALNISPAQFQDPGLATRLLAILSAEQFPPSRLEVEVTESALVGNLPAAKATLEALHGLGIKVALDDFGTGYSSLYHLRELKFDKLKIDRSFVQSMRDNQESEKIVAAVLSLAKSLGMPAIAEGIEDSQTMGSLLDRGCQFGQGYYFSKAVSAADAKLVLNREEASRASA